MTAARRGRGGDAKDAWHFPRGSGALSPPLFDEIQRVRIFEAVCALLAERGYAKTTVAAVVGEAGVSTKTFYDYFDNRESCLLAAYRFYGDQLGADLAAAWSGPPRWEEKVAAAIAALLGFGAEQPAQLHFLLLDASSVAPALLAEQREALELIGAGLREGREVDEKRAADLGPGTEEMIVAGLAQRLGRCLLDGDRLADLQGELVEFALAPYLGREGARELADALAGDPPSTSARPRRGGSHSPALVDDLQRRRVFDALPALLAEQPYGELTVSQILHRTGMSSRTFNALFDSKDDCLTAAYRAFAEQLRSELLTAYEAEGAWPAKVRAVIAAALAFAVEHPDIAHLLAFDIRAAGPAALAAQDESIERLAAWLREGRDRLPEAARLNRATEEVILAGVVTLIGDRLAAGDVADLPGLEDDLTELLLAPSRGWL